MNWLSIVVTVLLLAASAVIAVIRFFKQPSNKQIEQIKQWLLWAVTEAEKTLGGGTGKLKLAMVYEKFLGTFPWFAKIVSVEFFGKLVDDVLDKMKSLVAGNTAVEAYVNSDEARGV